ncbi:MAG: hypothetical protein WKH64_12010 [Chloroflexia bacterium]
MLGRFLDGGVAMYEDPTREAGSEKALEVIKGDVARTICRWWCS